MNERIIPTEYKEYKEKIDKIINKKTKNLTDEDTILLIYESYLVSQKIAEEEKSDIDKKILNLIIEEAGYNINEINDTKIIDIFEGLKYLSGEKLKEIFVKTNLILLFESNLEDLNDIKEDVEKMFDIKGE